MKMKFDTLTGACVVDVESKRPDSFLPYAECGAKTFVCFPSEACDFDAVAISERGAVIPAPIETSFVLSAFFAARGIPKEALTIDSCGERFDIPCSSAKPIESCEFNIKCKPICTNTVDLSGGMPHVLYTVGDKVKTRIIEAPSETDISRDLLRRIRVVKGLPDAARSIAFRESDGCYRIASSDDVVTVDSVIPMLSLACRRGRRGRITVILRGVSLEFMITDRSCGEPEISCSGFFGAIT